MSVVEKGGGADDVLEPNKKKWGDLEGKSGEEVDDNAYEQAFREVRDELSEGSEYMMFENQELPKEQVLEKYTEELEPGEDEYLKAELEEYQTEDGEFKIMTVEKGEIEGLRIASKTRSHRPVVTTDQLPEEGQVLTSVQEGPSDRYRIMWEE